MRYLGEDEYLYTGSSVKIETEGEVAVEQQVVRELERVIRPQPNSRVLFWRPRLWFYNVAGEPEDSRIRYWLRNRLGRPPVLLEDAAVERNISLLENRLYNMGFFDSRVRSDTTQKRRKAEVNYTVHLSRPYVFGKLHPPAGVCGAAEHIKEFMQESLIEKGARYSLETLKKERERIDRQMRRKGYYFFHHDYLLFRADSLAGRRSVDLYLTLKEDIPASATKRYKLGDINVYAGSFDKEATPDTLRLDGGINLFDEGGYFRPAMFEKAIFLREGDYYSYENHRRTLSRLFALGVFKFVNVRFTEIDEEEHPLLRADIFLTPVRPRSLSGELKGVSKSNNFAGPAGTASLNNRNLMGGAENLSLGFNVAYETLIGGKSDPASSRQLGMESKLSVPRLLMPFKLNDRPPLMRSETDILLSFDFMSRTEAFNLSSARVQYTYNWNRGDLWQHRLSPLVFNVFALGSVSENIERVLIESAFLRRGFFEQFIIGSQYGFVYNSQLESAGSSDIYFSLNLDFSGNTPYALLKYVLGVSPSDKGYYSLLGQGFSQYSRAEFDLRHYRQLGEGRKMATRLAAGVGIPYGNSSYLPYMKTFSTGGTNSIRAFHPRTLGPGSYRPEEELHGQQNILRTGDVKLEVSAEYRFDMSGMFKGALFTDAGNIWRLREEENTPGGKFQWDSFYREIAVGAGTGLRVDAQFFLLRLDFAFPLILPYDSGTIQPVRPFDKRWRRENLIFNLGIGYPF